MSKRILCKFFANGTCLKGENCEFSHDWEEPRNKICTYYQKGICSYGSRCRYAHTNASQLWQPTSSSSGVPRLYPPSDSNPHACTSGPSRDPLSPFKQAWNSNSLSQHSEDAGFSNSATLKPEQQLICSYAAAGDCLRGRQCPRVHGDICATCGKGCLHPFRPEEREEHMRICEKKQKQIEALRLSEEIECCVCLERILSKPTPAERKFGLLTECDHPFCISCIRNWRSSSPTIGMDINSTLRACPICRKLSYFVVPSVTWYSDPEEKKEIIDNYKAKLGSIDCKHFNFGDGNCAFGTRCFYKHTVKEGSYAWRYHKPPPRRPHARPTRYNISDEDTLFNMVDDIFSDDEFDIFGLEDSGDDESLTTDMIMLLTHMDIESDDSSNGEGYLF